MDRDNIVRVFNPAAAKILRMSAATTIGRDIREILPAHYVDGCLQQGKEYRGDILLLKEALNEALAGGSSISIITHTGVFSATDQHVYDELNVNVHGSNGVRAGFCIMPCCEETKTRMLWMYSSFVQDRSPSQLSLPDEMYYTTGYFRSVD